MREEANMARTGIVGPPGTRYGRGRLGCLWRSRIMPIATRRYTNTRQPDTMFTIGMMAPRPIMTPPPESTPVKRIALTGVPRIGSTLEKLGWMSLALPKAKKVRELATRNEFQVANT